MDNKTAIGIIKNCTMLACEYHIKNKCSKDYGEKDKDFEASKKIAISAIEKQIPKKPNVGNDNGRKRKCCPVCGCFYSPTSRYCPKCGQALNLED